jgi:CRP/FNR family transcriptional regulator, anaerobic regulatory protein
MNCVNEFFNALNKITKVSHSEISIVVPMLELKEFKKRAHLLEEGNVENYVYYVVEGIIRNYCSKDGDEISLDFFFAGNFTNSYMSFLTREKSIVSVQALTDVKIVRIHYDNLQILYASSLAFSAIGRILTEGQYIKRTKRELSFITKTARERYEDVRRENPELIQNIPQKYLSTFLGISPETLSRLRSSDRE